MKEIRHIISFYDAVDHSKDKLALASVVNVEESSYRRIGARMIVSSSGQWVGGISGGCLEGDALKRSQIAIFKNKPSKVVYDTLEGDSHSIGVGLGCNGKIEVLFMPIDPTDTSNVVAQLRGAVESGKPSILLQIIESKDTPTLLGKSVLANVDIDDLDFYKLPIERLKAAIDQAKRKQRPHLLSLTDKSDNSFQILIEYIRPETKLVIIGDNYDVNALVGIALELGWEIHIVGKQTKISKALYQKVKAVYDYENYDKVPVDTYSAVVLMTHDYNIDKKLLPQLLKQNLSYLGLLGPHKRWHRLKKDIDISSADTSSFIYSPVGLDIGAESPEEIAVSITAEIISVFRGREGRSLKFRKGTIHERT